jgi:DNA-binding response OmpR family regulator
MKILVCDDDPDMQFLLSYLLKKSGHTPIIAQNKEDVIAQYSQDLDLILMDYQFGDDNGPDVIRMLNVSKKYQGPVILITAEEKKLSPKEMSEYGIIDVIYKPFDPQKLFQYFFSLSLS